MTNLRDTAWEWLPDEDPRIQAAEHERDFPVTETYWPVEGRYPEGWREP